MPAGIKQRVNLRQIALDQRRETGLDLGLHLAIFNPRRVVQPLVAAAQHIDQQAFQPAGVVVHERQRSRHHVGIGAAAFDHLQRAPGGGGVMRLGILADPWLGAETAEIRHLPGEAGAQGVERRDAQPPGMPEQTPDPGAVVGQYIFRQFKGQALVRLLRHFTAGGAFQAAENTVTHFGCGLVGEGQRQHLFRVFNHGQQTQVTLCQ